MKLFSFSDDVMELGHALFSIAQKTRKRNKKILETILTRVYKKNKGLKQSDSVLTQEEK